VLLAAAAAPAAAEHHEEVKAEAEAHAHHHNGAYVRNLDFVGGRAVDLAAAIPEEAYGWRPMEGVRSVSESIMHMANANYFFASRLGTSTPKEVEGKNLEEITEKDTCVAALEKSIGHLAKALGSVEDTEAAMEIFGRDGTAEDMMQIAIGHVHEHFGQLIAYARSNGVVPPWSK
jgi:uncharacterized damage-inducible protein DinB